MSRTSGSEGDVAEQPIHELSALRDVQPPAGAGGARDDAARRAAAAVDVAVDAAPVRIELKLSPLAIIALTLGMAALFVLIGATMK